MSSITSAVLRHRRLSGIVGLVVVTVAVLVTGFGGDLATSLLVRLYGSAGIAGNDYEGQASLEERIAGADVIARVRLRSVSQNQDLVDFDSENSHYVRTLEFTFDVVEILKGTAGNSIVGVVHDMDVSFNTRQGALLGGEDFLSKRDTRWDNREAIIFLVDDHQLLPSTSQADRFWLGMLRFYGEDHFTIASRNSQHWLPDSASGAVRRQARNSTQRFLLQVPLERAGGQSDGAAGTSTAEDYTTISIDELKSKIAAIEAEIALGDGSEEYRECVHRKYVWEGGIRHREEVRGNEYPVILEIHDLVSGLASGTRVYQHAFTHGIILEYGEVRPNPNPDGVGDFVLGGTDAPYFASRYPGYVSTVRPLIQREYTTYLGYRFQPDIICDAMPEGALKFYGHDVTVTAPAGTLHELFFDPMGSGNAVFADRRNGVLEPRGFTGVGGSSASIDEIAWESGTVTVGVTPHDALNGHALDVIELDGSISLSLDVADATVDQGNDTLSWTVASQPWEDGDLLMIRIRES